MNKNLEKIREKTHFLRHQFTDAETCEALDDIDIASQDMAKEIEKYETLKAIINLCDYCQHEFAVCESKPADVEWGAGKGGDNVIVCSCFLKKDDIWKRFREQVKEIEELKAKAEMMSKLPAEAHTSKPVCNADPEHRCSKHYMGKCYSGKECLFKGLTEEQCRC